MNLDYPNNEEQQMKKSVEQYEAPFDPAAWQKLKGQMAGAAKSSKSGNGHRSFDDALAPGISFIFKPFLIMTFISLFSLLLWFGLNPTTTTTDTIDHNSIHPTIEQIPTDESSRTGSIRSKSTEEEKSGLAKNASPQNTQQTEIQNGSNETPQQTETQSASNKTQQQSDQLITANTSSSKTSIIKSYENNTLLSQQQSTVVDHAEAERVAYIPKKELVEETPEKEFNPQNLEGQTVLTEKIVDQSEESNPKSDALFLNEQVFRSSAYGINILPNSPLPTAIADSTFMEELDAGLPRKWPMEPIGDFRRKRFSFGLLIGGGFSTISDTLHLNPIFGLTSKIKLSRALTLQVDASYRRVEINNAIYRLEGVNEMGYNWLRSRELNGIEFFELPVVLSYQFVFGPKNPKSFRLLAGLRPTLNVVPTYYGIGSNSPTFQYIEPHYKEGIRKVDLGLILGFDLPITRLLSIDFRTNIGFRDMTDDTFWNINPQKNINTDFQVTLRWDIFNF